jgi:hypothetical protein
MENNDNLAALMAELNGDTTVADVDPAPSAPADPLKVGPAAQQTAVKAFTAGAASRNVRGYAITVEGLYLAPSNEIMGKKTRKPYSLVVKLEKLDGALSTIKNKMLDKMLKHKYPDYVTYTTHEITRVEPMTPDTPPVDNVQFMDEAKLLSFIEFKKVPVSPKNYEGDVKNLRAAVVDFLLNPKGFEEREAKRLVSIAEDRELAKLNPELGEDAAANGDTAAA